MKRCTAVCAGRARVGFGVQPRRWASHDRHRLTNEALLRQAESQLGLDVDGNPVRIDTDTKTINTPEGSLPISPIMDPDWIRGGRREKKRTPGLISGQFRKRLSNNPFAMALMSPIRHCSNTDTDLPRYFLQDFELVEHPVNTDEAWWAPGPLALDSVIPVYVPGPYSPTGQYDPKAIKAELKKARAAAKIGSIEDESIEDQGIKIEFDADEEADEAAGEEAIESVIRGQTSIEAAIKPPTAINPRPANTEDKFRADKAAVEAAIRAPFEAPTASKAPARTRTFNRSLSDYETRKQAPITTYMLARKAVLEEISKETASKAGSKGKGPTRNRFLTIRRGTATDGFATCTGIWRSDMQDFVLKQHRRCAVDALIYRAERSHRHYKFMQKAASWDEAKTILKKGCILWQSDNVNPTADSYATLDLDNPKFAEKMPVHNLTWLLGEEELQRLRDSTKVFRENKLVVLKLWRSESMRKLHLLLWRLQGYQAQVERGVEW